MGSGIVGWKGRNRPDWQEILPLPGDGKNAVPGVNKSNK
jgi:hypothetical protein